MKINFDKRHQPSDKIRKAELRKCWWVYFDVNGNAPADADVVACATKELAEEVLEWFASMKNDEKEPYVVLNGNKYSELPRFAVEGYDFDTYYDVREGEAEEVFTSLAEVVKDSGIFECHEPTTEPDGVYYGDAEETDEE